MEKLFYLFILLILFFGISSCSTVKPYQKMYLNDSEMQLGGSSVEYFETYVHSIREGATTAGGTKSGDGCGCN